MLNIKSILLFVSSFLIDTISACEVALPKTIPDFWYSKTEVVVVVEASTEK